MRKITLFLMSLFLTVGAMAQVVADGVYTIQADEGGKRGYLAASSDHGRPVLTEISWSNYSGNSCRSIIENGKLWYVKTIDGVTYLSNIGNGQFIYDNGTDNIYFGAPFGLNFTNHNSYIHVGSGNGTRYLSMGCGRTVPNQVNWEKENGNDGGCLLTFNEVENGTTTYATQIAAADMMIAASKKYVSFGVYTINNEFNGRGTLAYGKYGDTEYFGLSNVTLSDANNDYSTRDVEVENDANKYWCIAQTDKGMYIYNIGKGVFLQNRTGDVATCSQNVANGHSFEERRNGSYVSIKNGDYYLSFSPGWYPNQGAVRWLTSNEEAATLLTLRSVNFASYVNELTKLDAIINACENPYELNVTDAGWATLFLDYNAAIPENVDAYIVTGLKKDNWLELVEVTGILPANTGVLVNANKGDYTFYYSTTAATTDCSKNKLEGSVTETTVKKEAYVLGYAEGTNELVFGKAKLTDGSFLNNANKAYLPATVGASLSANLRFDFGGTTAIEEVETEAAETVIYDLTGRRVNEITKAGVYIINGKKVLVK